jgi:hypothetical protein
VYLAAYLPQVAVVVEVELHLLQVAPGVLVGVQFI